METESSTVERITHDLASIDRVVYRKDLLKLGVHGWMIGGSGASLALYVSMVSYPIGSLPTQEQWSAQLAELKASHRPSFIMASAA